VPRRNGLAQALILAAYWIIAPYSGCMTAPFQEQLHAAPLRNRALPS